MKTIRLNSRNTLLLAASLGMALTSLSARAQTLIGDYTFDNTLNNNITGSGAAPALTATDPQGTSDFGTATVFGTTHAVYNFNGNAVPVDQQAGLTVNTTGVITPNNYSVQIVASLNDIGGWRRLIDVQNRASDNGFYYDPNHVLNIFPVAGAGTQVLANTFEDVVLTVSAGTLGNPSTVKAYLNNDLEFTTTTDLMNIDGDPLNNPGLLMNFFLDNTVGGGQFEYSSGSVAEIKLYDGVLSDDQVAALDAAPLSPPNNGVPDATSTFGLLGLVGGLLIGFSRNSRRR